MIGWLVVGEDEESVDVVILCEDDVRCGNWNDKVERGSPFYTPSDLCCH